MSSACLASSQEIPMDISVTLMTGAMANVGAFYPAVCILSSVI